MARNNFSHAVYIGLLGGMLWSCTAVAQTHRLQLRRGNKLYNEGQYTKAQQLYESIAGQSGVYRKDALFALGNTLYKTQKYEEASKVYSQVLELPDLSPLQRAEIHHNIGNIAMQGKQYAQAIESYKKSLILNPNDEDTRYNLVLAQKQLQKQNNGGGGQSEEQKQDHNQTPEQTPPQQNQSQSNPQQSEQKQSPEQSKQQENQGQNKSDQQGPMDRKQIDQLLDSYRQSDDETRRRVEQEERSNAARHQKQKKRTW